jgi:hypothetical protein
MTAQLNFSGFSRNTYLRNFMTKPHWTHFRNGLYKKNVPSERVLFTSGREHSGHKSPASKP